MMAAKLPAAFARNVGCFRAATLPPRSITILGCHGCLYSTEPPPPPLLAKLKGDIKAAMRAKDTARLAVLRSILAATLNASKTASPIQTDAQVVALLRKTARTQQEAAKEFCDVGRQDLVEKEEAQIRVLNEYVAGSGVESISDDSLKALVQTPLGQLAAEGVAAKLQVGEAMKRLMSTGGPLEGKDVSKGDVAKTVRELSATN
jgi:uncharacterized protein YqeY